MKGKIIKVSGPLIVAENMADSKMYDVVRVSEKKLIAEIIELRGDQASIQVYEETSGLGPGEEVESTGAPLSVELAPGVIGEIFDGIQRPLERIFESYGDRITRGISMTNLDHEKIWSRACRSATKCKAAIFWAPYRKRPSSRIRSWCLTAFRVRSSESKKAISISRRRSPSFPPKRASARSVCCNAGPSERGGLTAKK